MRNTVVVSKMTRWWLAGILLFLPFQYHIANSINLWSDNLAVFVGFLDEITVIVFLPLSIVKFYRNREFPDRLYLVLFFPVFVLILCGIMSGMVNKNSLFPTIWGTFYYVKNFLVIFIYATFFREFRDLKKIFYLLLAVAFFLVIIALIQELWALASRYVFEHDIADKEIYILSRQQFTDWWRLGIYRAPSLMINSNTFGIYVLLIFTIYIFMIRKTNSLLFVWLLAGILMSLSKMVYTSFIFIVGLQTIKARRWLIALLLPIAIVNVMMFYSHYIQMNLNKHELSSHHEFVRNKLLAREVAKDIWKSHSLMGAGPGIFNGVLDKKITSSFTEEFEFPQSKYKYLIMIKSLDKFWLRMLAEMGIIGAVAFVVLLVSLIIILCILRFWSNSVDVRGLFSGLMAFAVVIIIHTLGSGLNITSILFTYFAFIGMGIGCETPYYK